MNNLLIIMNKKEVMHVSRCKLKNHFDNMQLNFNLMLLNTKI